MTRKEATIALQKKPGSRGPARIVKKENEHRLNSEITAREIRLVGEEPDNQVVTTHVAIEMAKSRDLDLVEIAPNAVPPVCRILDYQKFLYDKKKKEKEIKAKTSKTVIKEIRFGPNTDDHDFEFKLKHAQRFLEEGAKVKAYVHFRGRAIAYKEKGEIILLRFAEALEEFGKVESLPQLEGNKMNMFIAPKKK